MDMGSELTGTRIFRPSMSAAVLTGALLLVVWRKPLSHIFSKAYRRRCAMAARTCAPSAPSMAPQTWL
ncbi:hypothetical protein D3C74_505760 [compost metagenome]